MIIIWVIIILASVAYYWVWCTVGLICALVRTYGRTPPSWARRIMSELKPLYWPVALVLMYLAMSSDEAIWRKALDLATMVAGWYLFKNEGDDDRWKRRLEKLKEKVTVKDGRLVVTSA